MSLNKVSRTLLPAALVLFAGCTGASDDCIALSDAYQNDSSFVARIIGKGWKVQNAGNSGNCTPSHSLRIAVSAVDFRDGFYGHYGVASFADLKSNEPASLITAFGPNQRYVEERMMNAVIDDLPTKK